MQIINWKKFADIALPLNKKAFIVYMAYLRVKMSVYQALKAQIALLFIEEVSVSKKYADFADVFSK